MTWCNLSAKDGTSHVSVAAPLDLSPLENKTEAAHDTLAKLAAWIADVNTDLESLHDVADGAVGGLRDDLEFVKSYVQDQMNKLNRLVAGIPSLVPVQVQIDQVAERLKSVEEIKTWHEQDIQRGEDNRVKLWAEVSTLQYHVDALNNAAHERMHGLETVIANIQIPPKFKQNHWPVVIATAVSVLASLALHYIR